MKKFITHLRNIALIIVATGSLISCSNDFHDWEKDPPSPPSPDPLTIMNEEDFGKGAFITTFNIPSTDSFADAKSAIEATPAGNYILNITGDVDVVGENITQYADTNISLRGGGTIHKSSKVNGSLFNLYNLGNRIILRDATLKGNNDNIYSLVYVNGPDDSTEFVMLGGEIKDNNASGNAGGAVYVHQGTFTMRGGTIHDNNTSTNGGGVYVGSAGKFTMYDGTIRDNNASGNGSYNGGGGVHVKGIFVMHDGTISYNNGGGGYSSLDGGGGVYVGDSGTFTMNNGTIGDNKAGIYGGGVYVGENGTFTMNDGTISGNTASTGSQGYGGGVAVYSSTFTMYGGTISNNTVNGSFVAEGGGVSVLVYGTFTAVDPVNNTNRSTYIYDNKAKGNPNQVYNDSGTLNNILAW